jgi:organic radical activating enzyme
MIKEIKNTYPSNLLRIEYMLGNTCNYKCSYCFPGSNEGNYRWPDVEIAKQNLNHLLNHYKNNGKDLFQFYLIGGEPTIWKELPELLDYLKSQHNVIVNISTNASRTLAWWKKNYQHYDMVEISVHHQFADVEHINQIADFLYENNICLVANVLMDPDHFDKCKSIVDRLLTSKTPFPIIAKSVHFNGITRYSELQKEYFKTTNKRMPDLSWFNKTSKEPVKRKNIFVTTKDNQVMDIDSDSWFKVNNVNNFEGWTCNLGVDHIEIYQDGTISGNCRQKIWNLNTYHNLYSNDFLVNFKPEIKPIICSKNICACSSEIIINKKYNA